MNTVHNIKIDREMLRRRLAGLINQFYKILPIKESGESTLRKYMLSLQREMLGSQYLIIALQNDERYLTLMSILQYLIEVDCDVDIVRCEVFKCISILKKLSEKYGNEEEAP